MRWLAAGLSAFIVLGCSAASNFFFFFFFFFSSSSSSSSSDQTPPGKQVWAYSFNGPADSSVNTSYCEFNTGRGIFGTGEVETMTSSLYNVHLDGHGDLDPIVLGHGAAGSAGAAWTSGRIRTKSQFEAPAAAR